MSINYYCSGFNTENAFWPALAGQLKKDLTGTERIVYIPGSNTPEKMAKAFNKYIPAFTEHFRKIGICFDNVECITPEMGEEEAKTLVMNSNMVLMMGGNPFLQQELYTSKGLGPVLQNYNGVILGFSAGAMNMSKYIIITPCSEEYPDFDIRPGLDLNGLSIYPHNNFEGNVFPNQIDMGGEITVSSDLLKVAKEFGSFYCLQDYTREDGLTNVSLIRAFGDNVEIITDNDGKVWKVTDTDFQLVNEIEKHKHNKR